LEEIKLVVSGVYSGSNPFPGAHCCSVVWTDSSNNLWLFGGAGYDVNGNAGWLNDLWKWSGSCFP